MEELNAQPQANETEKIVEETTPQTIKVKYNHEELELPVDQATALIQKGLNYDKIYEKYEGLSKSKALKILNDRAERMGITADELAQRMENEISESEVKELAEAKGYDAEDARRIIEAQTIKANEEKRLQADKQKAERDQWINDQIGEFKTGYPDINIETDLPNTVVDLWLNQNIPLTIAYKAYLADNMPETKKEIKAMQEEVNKENAAKSMGDVQSKGDAENMEINAETIKKMTPEQRRANMGKLMKWVSETGGGI